MLERQPEQIRSMFGAVAPRYDLLNRLLSFGVDRYWRRRTRRRLTSMLDQDALLLDLCTGTGDLAFELSRRFRVVGCDFCHPMLALGLGKAKRKQLDGKVRFVEGDALRLPFGSGRFDGITIAFGLRNLESYAAGIREMSRVLNPTGLIAVLEFSQPETPVFRSLYRFYFFQILPRVGGLISGANHAYTYLPASVDGFPSPQGLEDLLREAGFTQVEQHRLTAGIATLHIGRKPGA